MFSQCREEDLLSPHIRMYQGRPHVHGLQRDSLQAVAFDSVGSSSSSSSLWVGPLGKSTPPPPVGWPGLFPRSTTWNSKSVCQSQQRNPTVSSSDPLALSPWQRKSRQTSLSRTGVLRNMKDKGL